MSEFPSGSLLLLGQAAVALAVAVFALLRRPSEATPSFVLTAVSAAWWSAAQALHISATNVGDRLFWGNATYWGIVSLPPAFLVFALRLSGFGSDVSRTVVGALGIVPAVSLWALYTNETHHLFALGPMAVFGSRGEQIWEPGPAFWVHTAYSYACIGFALVILVRAVFAQSGVLSRQMALLLVSGTVPLVANAMRLAKVGTAGVSIDPTPFALLISVALLPFALGRLRLLDILPGDRASAFARSPEALLVLDDQQRVTALSDRAAQVLGVAASGAIGQRIESILPNAERALLTAHRATARIEVQRGADNQLIGIRVSDASPGAERGERVVALRDETGRARELTAAHVRYQELFDDHPQAILIHDPVSLKIVSANRAAERDYGWKTAELLALSVRDLWAPKDERGLASYLTSLGSTTPRTPARHRRRDGSIFEVEIRSRAAVFDGAGATVLIVDDVTERREAEREAARLNAFVTTTAALWRSTVDSLQTPLLVLDGADRIFDLNRAAARHLGVQVRDAIGRSFPAFCDREPCRTGLELARQAQKTGAPAERHLDDLPGGGSCLVRCSAVADPDASSSRTVLLLQDTTELVQLQRKINNDAAFARLGAIVAGVAHDVRSPLASLTVNLDALAVEKEGDPSLEAVLPSLHRSINRINDLMKALLDYGRPTGEISRRSGLLDLAKAAVNNVADLARSAGVTVEVEGNEDLQPRMERRRVQQAIENMVQNAIQHSARGDAVLVEVDSPDEQGAAWARCRVSDRGQGFRPEALSRVFEPFYSRRPGGTGLGLAIVQRIAEQHEGRVRAENRAEGGAIVILEWPIG